MKQKYDITGMSCAACSANIEKSVEKLSGVKDINVNLLSNTMTVDYDEQKIDEKEIIKSVVNLGYGVNLEKENIKINELKNIKIRILISFIFLIPIFYIAMGHMAEWPMPAVLRGTENSLVYSFIQFLLLIPIIYVNRKYYIVGFSSLFKGKPNMDSLISIGSFTAIVYGIYAIFKIGHGLGHGYESVVIKYSRELYFESAAMILTLITLGKYFETISKGKTSEAISKLVNLAPKMASVVIEEKEIEIPVQEVKIGDIIVVKPGQSIPVDGVILEGETSIDEAALTGESIPVFKKAGDNVLAATINKSGFIKFKAVKVGNDTTLAKIIELVEEASSSKIPIAKLADKVSGVFVPIVITISVLAAAAWILLGYSVEFAISIGISVLVISCPCALGLATPVAIMVGTGKGAENGILIKSGEALEIAKSVDTVVIDKTGTLTEGKPVVTDIILKSLIFENELLILAASMEKASEHPLGQAIVEEALSRELTMKEVYNFKAVPGKGIEAEIEEKIYIAGNLQFMLDNNVDIKEFIYRVDSLAEMGKTPIYFASENKLLGIIAVADILKKTSKEAVKKLTSLGLDVIMLTGDNKRTAEAIKKQLGIKTFISEVLPQDKEKEIKRLQESGNKVAMVGDGINDAPALMRADVGIAVGAATDIAIESADIVLMKSDLLDVFYSIQLSKAVIRNIKQNLFWAFFYNSLGIPLAAGVFYTSLGWDLNPMFAAAAMSLSSLCVVGNALRLKFLKFKSHIDSQNDINNLLNSEIKNEKEEDKKMKKIMKINGMMCDHCSRRVEDALNALENVNAKVDLDQKIATIETANDIEDEILINTVTAAGYEVVSIE
ncbi:heavy metal translocating P-type ATPase [Anaerovorax odorimutans]|uniref:heavy metal translocating P-type ATPase n=1 Tax=Anaerovorax odorimutans TaxID=109327 RepID=UPI0004175988|nr:heavy metal translocating P-type ATPase [Anaerovorax odorimutans]